MKKIFFATVLFVSSILTNAIAETKIGPATLSFNAGYMSNYVFRGQEQNGGQGTAFAGVDASLPANLYLGIWTAGVSGSSSDPINYSGSNQEVDFYAGISPSFGPVTLDLGYTSFKYPGTTTPKTINFGEFYAGVKFQQDKSPFSIGAKIFQVDQGTKVETTEFSASYDAGFASFGAISGHTDNSAGSGADYWTISATKEIAGLEFTLAYNDNEMTTADPNKDKSTATLQVKKTF